MKSPAPGKKADKTSIISPDVTTIIPAPSDKWTICPNILMMSVEISPAIAPI